MKKTIMLVCAVLACGCVAYADNNTNANQESFKKIMKAIDKDYCTTPDGQAGHLERTGRSVSYSTSTSTSSSNSNSSSNSSSVSAGVSAGGSIGTSGANINTSVNSSMSTSGSNSSTNTRGSSNTNGQTITDQYSCFKY